MIVLLLKQVHLQKVCGAVVGAVSRFFLSGYGGIGRKIDVGRAPYPLRVL